MLQIKNVSLRAFVVSLRWATMIGKFPNDLDDWTKEQSEKIQQVAEEYDKRHFKGGNVLT